MVFMSSGSVGRVTGLGVGQTVKECIQLAERVPVLECSGPADTSAAEGNVAG